MSLFLNVEKLLTKNIPFPPKSNPKCLHNCFFFCKFAVMKNLLNDQSKFIQLTLFEAHRVSKTFLNFKNLEDIC